MKRVKVFSKSKFNALKQRSMIEGVQYLISPEKLALYSNGNRIFTQASEVLHDECFRLPNDLVAVDNIGCSGIFSLGKTSVEPMIEGIQALFWQIAVPLAQLSAQWFLQNLSPHTFTRLEVEDFIRNPRAQYVSTGTLMRTDAVVSSSGQVLSCDNNLIPLGTSDLLVYSNLLGFGQNLGYLWELSALQGIGGIVTQTAHPAWMGHFYIAKQVMEQTCSPFFVLPTQVFDQYGAVNANALRQFYLQLDPAALEFLPKKDFVPNFVVRFMREKLNFNQRTHVVNPYGQYFLESHLLSALLFVPGIDEILEEYGIADCAETVRAAHVLCLVAKWFGSDLYIAASVYSNSQGIEVEWVPAQDAANMFSQTLDYLNLPQKSNWFVKGAASSGKKSVRFTAKQSPQAGLYNKIVSEAQKISPQGEAFVLQPRIDSTVSTSLTTTERAKLEIFLAGPQLELVGKSLLTSPMDRLAVHGASDTKMWLVK